MAIGNHFKHFVRASMLALVLAGCEGQSMDQVFGIGDQNPAVEATDKPKPKPTPTPTPPPMPSPTPSAPSAIFKRNVAFDSVRSKGIAHVYQARDNKNDAEIDAAVATLNSAYRLKPNDRSIQIWLDAIAKGREKARQKALAGSSPGPFQNPPVGNSGMQGFGGQPPGGMPAGAPAVPPPPGQIPAASTPIDPRLVF
ncbi:MAG: hypothetical protein JWM80_5117 [Cyanobacteria bacterium RYN_339]|nr:hypothetical protein [Cyanobacteria bacterium RYN_339]